MSDPTPSLLNDVATQDDPVLSTGRRRSEVLSASLILRPNSRLRPSQKSEKAYRRQLSDWSLFRNYDPAKRSKPERALGARRLHDAVNRQDEERVEALLTCPGIQVDALHEGQTALASAVIKAVTFLPYPDTRATESRALMRRIVQRLLDAGAQPQTLTASGQSLLGVADEGPDPLLTQQLLEAGVDPNLGPKSTPLSQALARGDHERSLFWLTRSRSFPDTLSVNPWKALLDHLKPDHRTDAKRSYDQAQGRVRWGELDVLAWGQRLVEAGFSLEQRLGRPTPKTDNETSRGLDAGQDTPLVWAIEHASPTAVEGLLALGADPHAYTASGKHPFMAWVNRYLTGNTRLPLTPETISDAHQGALRFFSGNLLDHPDPISSKKDGPFYHHAHPLGALFFSACFATHLNLQSSGWDLVQRLLDIGLTCPPPVNAKESSPVERVVAYAATNLASHWQLTHRARPLDVSPAFRQFIDHLPGWQEAQTHPCSDTWNFQGHVTRLFSKDRRWFNSSNDLPLPFLNTLTGLGARLTVSHLEGLCEPLSVASEPNDLWHGHGPPSTTVSYLLSQLILTKDEQDRLFKLVLQNPLHPATLTCLDAFIQYGANLSERPDVESWVQWAAQTDSIEPLMFQALLDRSGALPASYVAGWPDGPKKEFTLQKLAQESEIALTQRLDEATAPRRARPRL